MLVKFDLNESKMAELNIPRHVADWHRIRILKEIDDIRYQAMTIANIDLTGESMESLKKLKLFSLFNPVYDTTLKAIKSYDNIVEAFDVPLEWYFNAANELYAFLARNYINVDPNFLTRAIRDDSLKVITNFQGTKCFFFFLDASELTRYKDAVFSAFNFMDYSGNFDFTNENSSTFWNFERYIPAGKDCARFIYRPTYSEYLLDMYTYPNAMTNISNLDVTVYHFKYNYDYTGYSDFRTYGTSFYPRPNVAAYYYFFNPAWTTIPEILKLETVLGYISSSIMHFAPLSRSSDILKNSIIKSITDKNTPIVCEEPYFNYKKPTSSSTIYTLASTDERSYTVTLTNESPSYFQFYRTQDVSLENGKVYNMPFDTYKYKSSAGNLIYSQNALPVGRSIFSIGSLPDDFLLSMTLSNFSNNIIEDIFPASKFFFEKNQQFYNFPAYFPRILLFNSNRIRNGLLYSDASQFYQLEFLKYPQATLDKIEELITQQEAINDLVTDLRNKFYFYEKTSTGINWFYYDNGIKMPFIHPITQRPVSGIRFLYEMIFEMIVLWGKTQSEIDKFLEARKIQNENAFNMAYQNYLRGQATINGPEALALFEEKLKTGMFYIENGFEYWRKYTTLELTLIEKFKTDAYKNAEIDQQNKEIRALNEKYQYEANLPIILENNQKLAEARLIAMPELKVMAEAQIASMVAPTIDYLIARAEKEGGFPTDILLKWTEENPFYFLRSDLFNKVNALLNELTFREQQVATAIVADTVSEINFTKALQELFELKG